MSHKKAHKAQKFIVRSFVFFVLFCGATLQGQQFSQVYLTFDLPDFKLWLERKSETVAVLEPKSAPGFDFTAGDRLKHQLGDLTLRIRTGTSEPWKEYDTSDSRQSVKSLTEVGVSTLVAADLSPTLPAEIPLQITRSWLLDNGHLVLSFELKNKTTQPVQIGALGIPMIFDNIITGRDLKEAHERASFADPYIGQDAGYLQVTRLSGRGIPSAARWPGIRRARKKFTRGVSILVTTMALVSLNSIIGYMPTLPHWGYNGNARRYWDFLYGGKIRRIERQLHHYGSGLNAIPVHG